MLLITLCLALLPFVAVVSAPRQMLAQFSDLANIPIEFRIIALSLPDYLALIILAVAGLSYIRQPAYRARLGNTFSQILANGGIWWVLLAIWVTLSALWAGQGVMARFAGLHVLAALAVAMLCADTIRQEKGLKRAVLRGLLLGGCTQALVALLQTLNQNPLGLAALGEIDRFWYEPTTFYRAPGLAMHSNYLAGYLVLAIFAALVLAISARTAERKSQRIVPLYMAAAVLCGVALMAALSRSGIVGLVGGLLPLSVLFWGRFDAQARKRLILAGVAVMLLSVILSLIFVRGEAITRFFGGREFFFEDSFAIISQRPILGTGAANLMLEIGALRGDSSDPRLPVHNVYLYVWATLGIPGLALFALACWASLRGLLKLGTQRYWPAFAWGCALLAGCIIMLFDNYFWAVQPFRMLWFWCIGVGWGLMLRRLA
jgi:O-antigen ligase